MNHLPRGMLLGCQINAGNIQQATQNIEALIKEGRPSQVITLNAEMVYLAQSDERLKYIINSAQLVTPDGIGVVWGARYSGFSIEERVAGIDLLHRVCSLCASRGYSMYLLGAAPGIAHQAGVNLKKLYTGLKICGSRDGYFQEEESGLIIEEIRKASPHVLMVALGAPKQEYWIHQHKEQLSVPVSIGVGGSFDVIAGVKKRAPGLFIKLNLEWLYRLLQEPGRIKRQMVLPRFVWTVLRWGRRRVNK